MGCKDNKKLEKERVGLENINNSGSKMKIIYYRKATDIDVLFVDSGYIRYNCHYSSFKEGSLTSPYDKNKYGGYFGEGKYKKSENKKLTWYYTTWFNMLRRIHDEKEQEKTRNRTYKDVVLYEPWYNFQNFAKWLDEEYYKVKDETMCLDKDILIKGNKIYSPETCIFVPEKINVLFTKRQKCRGNSAIGVYYDEKRNCFTAHCNFGKGKTDYLGSFNTEKEAFLTYKNAKEKYIKQVADEYKDFIPKKLYDALYKYEVEIND